MKKNKDKGKEMGAASKQSPTLEELENDYSGNEPDYPSHLVETIYSLRKKRLNEFTTEDLRIAIGQNVSLQVLLPIALNVLKGDILAEGDLYEGDLLLTVLNVKPEFWEANPELRKNVIEIFEKGSRGIELKADWNEKQKQKFFRSYQKFLEPGN